MERQIQCAAADASLPQYCLNAVCHLAAPSPKQLLIGLSTQSHANIDQALLRGAMKIWWGEFQESLGGLVLHVWWQYEA